MKTYTTKTAKNGATLYYSVETGKRIAKETALENERNYIINNGTTAERYALAKEEVDLTKDGRWEVLGKHGVMVMTKVSHDWVSRYEWHYVEEERAAKELAKYNLTTDEFRAEVEAEAAREEIMSEPFTTAEAIDATVEAANVDSAKKARKAYSVNPVINEDTPVKFNHVDIYLEDGTLNISGYFECKNIETAYRRFTKIMAQAANDLPELNGWDNWTPAKKITANEQGCWLNENGDGIFDGVYTNEYGERILPSCVNNLCVDINEDTFYIYGKFPNAYEVKVNAETAEEETKYFYTTNRGNVYEVQIGETGSTVRGKWYYYHEIGGLKEADVIELATKSEGNDFANLLCKFITTETDGSEDDSDEEIFSLLPDFDETEDDETDEPELLGNHPFDNFFSDPRREMFSDRLMSIGTDTVVFQRHRISSIKSRVYDAELRFENGRKQFRINGRVIARDKFIAHFENLKLAKEQRSTLHEFFKTVQDCGKFFKVIVDVTLADGSECNFKRTFDYFNQAQDFIQKTSAFTDLPFNAWIARNIQGGRGFYYRNDDGTETFNIDEGYRLPAAEIKARVEELQRAIDENRRFENDNNLYAKDLNSAHNIFEANRNMRQAAQLHEFFLHETDAPTPTLPELENKYKEALQGLYVQDRGEYLEASKVYGDALLVVKRFGKLYSRLEDLDGDGWGYDAKKTAELAEQEQALIDAGAFPESAYVNGLRQRQAVEKFDEAIVDKGDFFKVSVTFLMAGNCLYTLGFECDYFNQAKDFIADAKATFQDMPVEACIKRNVFKDATVYYHREFNGTEIYGVDESYRLTAADLQERVDEIKKAISDNETFPCNDEVWYKLCAANRNMEQELQQHEFFLHETDEPAPTSEPAAETQAYEQRIRQVQASCERFSDRHARTKDASRRAYYSRQIERCRNEIAHLQRQINSLKENAA